MKLTAQVRDALKAAGIDTPAPAKYRNRVFEVDGVRWHSKREYERWLALKAMERDGLIRDLERQVTVPLVVNGVQVCRLVIDFRYYDVQAGCVIHDDAKGFRTPEYRLKAKLYAALFGQTIRET